MSFESLSPALREKYDLLAKRLANLESVIVAYSGGVDSGLLAAAAFQVLGDRMLAVTVSSPVETPAGLQAAQAAAAALGFPHRVVEYDDLTNPQFVANSPERCYFCKRERLGQVQALAAELGYAAVAEGSNADDSGDYRPGKKAVAELGVYSPLADVGMTKAEVRALAKALGLPSWNRPSAPCLATRFPYGTAVTREGIAQIARGEDFLAGRGYQNVRVRHYGKLARLEVEPSAIQRLIAEREEVAAYFKTIGYSHVAVDLLGYRSGSLNEGVVQA